MSEVSKDMLSEAQKYSRQYYIEHKDARTAYTKQYYLDNKDHIKAYNASHHPVYYADNKGEILARSCQYYKDNTEIINLKQRVKFNCDCGGKYTLSNKAQHERTHKHIKSLEIA